MNGDGIMHKPVVGRIALGAMRAVMRTINHIPPARRRLGGSHRAFRDQDGPQAHASAVPPGRAG
jgi:hypothetical protein